MPVGDSAILLVSSWCPSMHMLHYGYLIRIFHGLYQTHYYRVTYVPYNI